MRWPRSCVIDLLAKRPDDRFATAAELVQAVADALDDKLPDAIRARARAIREPS